MSSSDSASTPAIKVVVVEDEALIRMDLAELLAEEGYDVVGQASDGEEAMQVIQDLQPDVVMMDVQMPRMDGLEAARRIASERLAAVVMLTAFSQRELVEQARQAGAMAYLVKPFNRSDLVPAIELARSRFVEARELAVEVTSLTAQLAARKTVERAKSVLSESLRLTEPEAFRWIQKTAMDLRVPMVQVAEKIIADDAK